MARPVRGKTPAKEVYRKFLLETANLRNFPPKFGNDWFAAALSALWNDQHVVTDWLGFEMFCRDVLSSKLLSDEQRVGILREAVGAFTRRGPVETSL